MREYYDRRASEYDDWYLGLGLYSGVDRPGWWEELQALEQAIAALSPGRVVDVACGTGFLTRHLQSTVVGIDQSDAMLEIARSRVPSARFVRSDAFALPFSDGSFDRVFTAHFYGHLDVFERAAFLEEARRVAPELVVVDSALREDVEVECVQERLLKDGSTYDVYKRYFTPESLLEELGGGRTLHSGRWFLAVQA